MKVYSDVEGTQIRLPDGRVMVLGRTPRSVPEGTEAQILDAIMRSPHLHEEKEVVIQPAKPAEKKPVDKKAEG